MQKAGYPSAPAGTTTLVLDAEDARHLYGVLVRLLGEQAGPSDESSGMLSAAWQLSRCIKATP
ncbi:MAG: hypothetical protein ABSA65_03025 [Acidimicrobiales bacterium]|jgi:hypothetical protein